jgi:hypothetical protein
MPSRVPNGGVVRQPDNSRENRLSAAMARQPKMVATDREKFNYPYSPQGGRGKGEGAAHTDANRSKTALMRKRVGAQLEPDDQGTRQSRLALAGAPGAGASMFSICCGVRLPELAHKARPLPAGVRVVDAAFEPFGEEPHRIGHPQFDEMAVDQACHESDWLPVSNGTLAPRPKMLCWSTRT